MRSQLRLKLGVVLLVGSAALVIPVAHAAFHKPTHTVPADSTKKRPGFFKRLFGGKKEKRGDSVHAPAPVLMEKIKEAERQTKQLSTEKEQLSQQLSTLNETQSKMNRMLRDQQVSLRTMTEAQIRTQLILTTQKKMIDSIAFGKTLDSLNQAQAVLYQQAEIQRREVLLAEQRTQQTILLAAVGLVVLMAIGLYSRYHSVRKYNRELEAKNQVIREEKQRSEELLLNILPAVVADELKKQGFANARLHETVSVLFTDFVNFTKISEHLTPQELVAELDECFRAFDGIIARHGLEKIKVIGDAYMCVGGLTTPDADHADQVVSAALDIQAYLEERNAKHRERDLPVFEARLGIHTGPVVAGVVGLRKFAYDIWGDTVNVASRLETNSLPGKINISESTYQLIREKYACSYRGKIPTKNKGDVDMYFVEDRASVEVVG
jgi:class 3 adenylate cyclase